MFDLSYQQLSRFAGSLATCLDGQLSITRGLEISLRTLGGRCSEDHVADLVAEVAQGEELATALSHCPAAFPDFFLELLRAGERTGYVAESLRFLEHHCALLAGPTRAFRNTWLYPLVIIVFGSVAKLVAYLTLAPFPVAASFLFRQLLGFAVLGGVVVLLRVPAVQPLIDQLKLALPWLGSLQRDLARNRFCQVMALAYAVSGQRVEQMIRLAIGCVGNRVLAGQLEKVAVAIEGGASIPEACRVCPLFSRADCELLTVGDSAGRLEESFERISQAVGERLEQRLRMMQGFLVRLVSFLVILSMASTIVSLAFLVSRGS